ncbi:MAG: pyruvate ferredoxin oxidoreductase [Dictyoglomus sp. NZ13-RE01]|nr:MAG: pyruvate ferredoxin oxidoreductase [Dictyoglomus sp. NZ13-RE01]
MKVKGRKIAIEGNEAAALALKQVNPDVVAAYPITPSTEVVQKFSEYVANGEVTTEFVPVESEHSAMSACIGASAAGARVATSTASQGLALMWEMLYIASSMRLPIVMTVANRALSAPINIHGDHSDAMGARDAGWIQIFSENVQEIYDNIFQAFRIAEHPDVRLPVMVGYDGFITSHSEEILELLEDEEVKRFIGEYKPKFSLLDINNPITMGPLALFDSYFEFKVAQAYAIENSLPIIKKVGKEFGDLTGRYYDVIEKYYTDDADYIVVAMSSTCGTARVVVDELREKGEKVGLLKIRVFRPFPLEDVVDALKNAKVVGVLDRSMVPGSFAGPLYHEITSGMYHLEKRPVFQPYVYGLGGRDITTEHIKGVFEELKEIEKAGKPKGLKYIGVRE